MTKRNVGHEYSSWYEKYTQRNTTFEISRVQILEDGEVLQINYVTHGEYFAGLKIGVKWLFNEMANTDKKVFEI